MTNKVQAANTAAWTLVSTLFADDAPERDPPTYSKPKPQGEGLANYVAFESDKIAEEAQAAVMGGGFPIYTLNIAPCVTFAFGGGTSKAQREAAAYDQIEILKAGLVADRTLGGAVDYAELDPAENCDADGDWKWMAGGLQVCIRLLFDAPSKAG